jgi:excisionase family DNA binding protein
MTIDEALRSLIRDVVREELAQALARISQPQPESSARLTVEEAAKLLKCSTRSVRRYIEQGRLRASRATHGGGSRVLISRDSVEELTGGEW